MYVPQRLTFEEEVTYIANDWVTWKEPIGLWGKNNFTSPSILEHLNVTKDKSDYLWYTTRSGTIVILTIMFKVMDVTMYKLIHFRV